MSYNKRRIINHSIAWATDSEEEYRNKNVSYLEFLRNEVGIRTKDIDDMMDLPQSWYSNRIRGGKGSHEFMLKDYEMTRAFLENLYKMSQNDIEIDPENTNINLDNIKEQAYAKRNEKIEELLDMADMADIESSKIDTILNKEKGWFESLDSDSDIPLTLYHRTQIFLESVLMIYAREGYLQDAQVNNMTNKGYVNPDLVSA